jgi:hypothetical protein
MGGAWILDAAYSILAADTGAKMMVGFARIYSDLVGWPARF